MNNIGNYNSSVPGYNPGMLTRIMSIGNNLESKHWVMIGATMLFIIVGVLYYVYYIAPTMIQKYQPNSESTEKGTGNIAELMFFYAEWCPHCKVAKPIINDLKTEYEHKTINGYKIIFTDVDCSEESDEVAKLMNQYSIEGYPTIKLLKDGQVIEYDAKPSKETLVKFLNTVL
jgi:thiol-disulfide isomerase/thioredoxin